MLVMLDTLITSKTRLKLLLLFFLNSSSEAHLRMLATELGDSSNSIRLELNKFEQAGLLTSRSESNRRVFKANTLHPLFPDINSIIRKYIGIDQILEKVVEEVGSVERVYLTGPLAHGINSPFIDLILVGGPVNAESLARLVSKAGSLINRHIRYAVMSSSDYDREFSKPSDHLLIFGSDCVTRSSAQSGVNVNN